MEEVILIYGTADALKKPCKFSKALQDRVFPPLGLLYLAGVLEKEKIKVGLIDLTILKGGINKAIERVKVAKPKVVGINVTSFNLCLVKTIISEIRKASPSSKIVVGGTHIHYCNESVIYLDADFGIVSDGEYSLLSLVRELLNDRNNFKDIPNLIVRKGAKIEKNALKLIEDLDLLPLPSRHLWEHEFYSPLIAGKATTTVTSRGCIFNCTFCGVPNRGTYRARSAGNVVSEFEYLEKEGYRYVELLDDTFTLNMNRVKSICRELIRKNIKLKWTCLTRIDYVDKELLCLMGEAKCTHIKYGIESGSEFIRNEIMKKFITNSQIKDVIRETKKAGIFTEGCFIVGAPEESLQDIKNTLRFSRNIGLDYADFHSGLVVPGSENFRKAINEGAMPATIWEELSRGDSVFYPLSNKVPLKIILDYRSKAIRGYYFRPGFLLREFFIRTRNFPSLINKVKVMLKLMNFRRRH